MAGDVLNGILASHLDNGYPIAEPKYTGGYPIEISPKVAFAIEKGSCKPYSKGSC